MLGKLLLLFILVPLLELMLLIDIGNAVGTMPTIMLIIFTGALGAFLAKREGLKTFFAIQSKMNTGELPASEMIDGLIILVAGVLLITPGIMTDVVGFSLLYPPLRNIFKAKLKNFFSTRVNIHGVNNMGNMNNMNDFDQNQ